MIKKIWINGTFDVIHFGHLKLLEFSSSLGDLRVGIDSDKRVKELKGDKRPFNSEKVRREMLLSLKCVNDVLIFDSREEMLQQINQWKPNIMVVGSDYKGKQVIGAELVDEVIFFDRIPNFSTTKILNFFNL